MISNDLLKQKILSNLIPFGKCENITLSKLVSKGKIGDGDWILSDDMCEYSSNKLVQLGSIGYGKYIPKNFKYITDETYERINCSEITFGDLLINRFISNSTMTCCILPCIEGRTITSVDVCWIKEEKDKYLNKYLMYCFLTKEFQDKVLNMSSGTTRIRISKNNLIKIEFPLPSISEQKKIVKKIEELFELIDKKEENDQEKDKLKLLLKEKILDSAIHGKLVENDLSLSSVDINGIEEDFPFEIASNWKWIKLKDVCRKLYAGGDKTKYFSKDKTNELKYPVIANGKENEGIIGYTNIPTETEECLTISGRGTIGYSVVRNYPFSPVVRLIVLKPCEFLLTKYLKYVMDNLLEKGRGTSIPQLTIPMIKDKLIPVPPLEQQKKIVEKIEQCFELIEQL